MDMKQIMKFNGTASRTAWWLSQIAIGVISLGLPATAAGTESAGLALFWLTATIPVTWFAIAVNKARLNEAGWSGWWQLMPIVNLVVPGFFGPEEESDVVGQT